jgi:hypothetical protein
MQEMSTELLKELHLLTRDGRMNSDAARKIKQIHHLVQFMNNAIDQSANRKKGSLRIADFGSGKSYLGFFLYDLLLKSNYKDAEVLSIEFRDDLVEKSKQLATRAGFRGMRFIESTILDSQKNLPNELDIVTALHACDTATDDVLTVACQKQVKWIFYVPCCQAELARSFDLANLKIKHLGELARHPHHRREFMSHLTNVMRGLFLESQGYKVRVSELVGWEHSLKNEIWIAEKHQKSNTSAKKRLLELIQDFGVMPKCVREAKSP